MEGIEFLVCKGESNLTLQEQVEKMLRLANTEDIEVRMQMGPICAVAHPGDSVEKIMMDCMEKISSHADGIIKNATEEQRKNENDEERKEREERESLERKLIENFPNLTNLSAIIDWFGELEDLGMLNPENCSKILETFQENGFESNAYQGCFREGKEEEARYIIGQALDQIASFGGVPLIYLQFAENWRRKYKV